MMEKLKLDDLELINTGDCKVLNIQVGVGPCSSKFPCGWCEAEKVGKKMVCTQDTRMRTEENVTQNNTEWLARLDKTKDTNSYSYGNGRPSWKHIVSKLFPCFSCCKNKNAQIMQENAKLGGSDSGEYGYDTNKEVI